MCVLHQVWRAEDSVAVSDQLLLLQVLAGEGRVYKCLFNHKFEEAMSERVS